MIVRMTDGARGAERLARFSGPFLQTLRTLTGTLVKLTKMLPISGIFRCKDRRIKS